MTEPKVSYITGALTGIRKNGKVYEATFYDKRGTYFFKKAIGMAVGNGYKIGIIDADKPGRYEIVSVEQPLLTDPAFTIKGPSGTIIQMKEEHYRNLAEAKNLRIRTEALKAATEICKATSIENSPGLFKNKVLKISKELEPYFE